MAAFKLTRADFPDDFMWGASTASHQVEGGNTNQWSVWELAHASEHAKNAPNKYDWLPNWPDIKTAATTPENYVSGKAVDHYARYEQDFDLAQGLGLNSFRFGIEWSRLQPTKDVWDAAAIQHYHDYIAALKARGIEPIMNLWHWTVPVWFDQAGGFAKRGNLSYWDAFVQKIADEFGHEVRYILTLNEPNNFAGLGYALAIWPPEQRQPIRAGFVYLNLLSAHKRAYAILKHANNNLQIGVAQNISSNMPKRTGNIIDLFFSTVYGYLWNWWLTNRSRKQQDFIGINFYLGQYWRGHKLDNPAQPINDMGWYMEPSKIYELLIQAQKRYNKPIIITENGVADARDKHRAWWLQETITAMKRAIDDGVDLRGYMHWSLLDNFEWADGWWPKFGLIAVNRDNGMKRTVKASAKWWGSWLKQ